LALYKVGKLGEWGIVAWSGFVFALSGFVFGMFFEWFFIEFIAVLHLIEMAVLLFVGYEPYGFSFGFEGVFEFPSGPYLVINFHNTSDMTGPDLSIMTTEVFGWHIAPNLALIFEINFMRTIANKLNRKDFNSKVVTDKNKLFGLINIRDDNFLNSMILKQEPGWDLGV
jgi:hypothetical protein